MPSETKSSGLLLGTLIGGVVGAVSALLLAPKTVVSTADQNKQDESHQRQLQPFSTSSSND